MQEGGRSEAGTRNKGPERTSPGPLWRFPGFTGCSDQQMAACPPDLVHPLGLASALTLPVQCWRSFNTPDPIFLPRVKGENYFALFLHSSHLPCLPGLGLSVQIQLFRSNQHAGDPTTCTSQSRFPAAVTLASRSPPPPKALGHLLAEMRPTLQANKER